MYVRRVLVCCLPFLLSFVVPGSLSAQALKADSPSARTCCRTSPEKSELLLSLIENELRSLGNGESGLILLRIARAIRPIRPEISASYLERALVKGQLVREVPDLARSILPQTEDQKFEAMYVEFRRQQETTEKRAILEYLNYDTNRAAELTELLAPSKKGYQRVRYGDVIRTIPIPNETNTYVLVAVGEKIALTDLEGAIHFLARNFSRLEEPVFSPMLRLLEKPAKQNPIVADQIIAFLDERITRLLKNKDPLVVLQSHVSLADLVARVEDPGLARKWAERAVPTTSCTWGLDFSKEIKEVVASAHHQYWVALLRFDQMGELAAKFGACRDRILRELGIDPGDFQKRQLTADVVLDPRKFAQAMSLRSREFGERLLSDAATFQMKYGNSSLVEIEKAYQEKQGLQRASFAMFLHERLFQENPEKAESYLREAREIILNESDSLNRLMEQVLLFSHGLNRCRAEFVRMLLGDALKTAGQFLEEHRGRSDSRHEVLIAGILGPLFNRWATADFEGAVAEILRFDSPWIRSHLLTSIVEALARESAPRSTP